MEVTYHMERKPDRKFGWLQFDATERMIRLVESFQTSLSRDDVIEVEDDPHVTVLYGLSQVDPDEVRSAVRERWSGEAPWSLGKLSVFKNKRSHVLKLEVYGSPLSLLNGSLQGVPHKKTFGGYSPHLTVAHLKPGRADQYLGLGDKWHYEGVQAPGDVLIFHSKDRQRYELPL